MDLALYGGSANPLLADAVARVLGVPLRARELVRFPDGELHVSLQESVRGDDVYVLQPTGPPVDEHLIEILFLADACRRAGAARITAVFPYFGYARQDRRSDSREAVGARVVADVLRSGGIARVVAVDLHNPALEGFFAVPLEHLTALPLLSDAVSPDFASDAVIVAPDVGAAKLADGFSRRLGLPVAIVHKQRSGAEQVTARAITGNVGGRRPIVVDDMISTGGTIEAAVAALLAAGALPDVTVVATHALLVGAAAARLAAPAIRRIVVTDSVVPAATPALLSRVSLANLLAEAIRDLNMDRSLAALLARR